MNRDDERPSNATSESATTAITTTTHAEPSAREAADERRRFLKTAASFAAFGVFGSACGSSQTPGSTGSGEAGAPGTGGATSSSTSQGTGGQGTGGTGGPGGAGGTGGAGGAGTGGAGGGEPSVCTKTAPNIEGPFYKAGAPAKVDLRPPGATGVVFHLVGRVQSLDCKPIAGALLDVWQADSKGGYDNAGFTFRGKMAADAKGEFSLTTIIPGHYLNGSQYRPAHVHVKISAPGFKSLTTQLYFEGDPYNDIDPFIDASLIMQVDDVGPNEKRSRFDITLSP